MSNTTLWTFRDAGSIPGIPGTFAGQRVLVDAETNDVISVKPLDLSDEQLADNEAREAAEAATEQGMSPDHAAAIADLQSRLDTVRQAAADAAPAVVPAEEQVAQAPVVEV